MQKEDLLKRMRLVVTLTTMVLVFLVVTLLVQFGFIAYYNGERQRLQEENTKMQAELDKMSKDLAYLKGELADDANISTPTN